MVNNSLMVMVIILSHEGLNKCLVFVLYIDHMEEIDQQFGRFLKHNNLVFNKNIFIKRIVEREKRIFYLVLALATFKKRVTPKLKKMSVNFFYYVEKESFSYTF